MGDTAAGRRSADPLSTFLQGMRRMGSLRLDDITRGFENFAQPSARGLLESLGRTREEQVEGMAALLRHSSQDDIDELGTIFGLAMGRLAEERAAGADHDGPRRSDDRRRRRRDQRAAERRRDRLAR